jgi:hypothetical protein
MSSLGDKLAAVCSTAHSEVVLVAPFIKVKALQQLLAGVSPVVKVVCVTRWRPEEIVAGVSDLEVWTYLRQRSNSVLLLRPDLHAKYYRADDKCLIGSANLTATALGWIPQPNLELLVPLPANHDSLVGFENQVFAGSTPATEDLYDQMRAAVNLLPEHQESAYAVIPQENNQHRLIGVEAWLPTLRHPDQLYPAYCGNVDNMTTASREAALSDLWVIAPPLGLDKATFTAYVGALLLQMPTIQKITSFVETPQRFGAVSALLRSLSCGASPDFDSDRAWQTLMRWLLYYLPTMFKSFKTNYSEIFAQNIQRTHQENGNQQHLQDFE